MTRIVIAILAAAAAGAAELRCVGVLGNSGEAGAALVRFSDKRDAGLRDGLGVVGDRFGTLWDRGGSGRLVRYALDGRSLATVAIPASLNTRDRLAVVGDALVLLIEGKLHTIDLAAAEVKAVPAKLDATVISRGSADGAILVYQAGEQPTLFSWNPRTGARSDLPLPEGIGPKNEINALELANGQAVVRTGGRTHRLVDGVWTKWALNGGERLAFVDGAWWTGAWHGTVHRFNAELAPDPGVVLGGASGSFIGHLDGNYEVSNPTGIAALGEGLYAVGGLGGVVHLASWDGSALALVRRIGPVQALRGHLAIDGQGRVHIPAGTWAWTDAPDAPLRHGTGMGGNGQVALLPNGALAASAFQAGPAMMWGTLDKEVSATGARFLGVRMELPADVVACAALPEDGGRRVLRITAGQRALESVHAPDGKPQKEVAVGTVAVAAPAVHITSLAVTADKRILAGADGCILELERGSEAGAWRERSRTAAVAGESLAGEVRISASAGRLWVSDGGNHRILVCDQALSAILARFGGAAGDDLAHCDRPAEIAAAGDRAVVHDAGNQRILKLEIR
ncbi:MAG: hypothetical protein J0M02_09335 [Planctomycetes bacterium]|nr:hypothetical protein [Planctomycetota bacterium]